MGRLERMRVMLAELERLAEGAREHERCMAVGLRASSSWSRQADRDWIRWAAVDATVAREHAEASLAEGRALLARVQLLARDAGRSREMDQCTTGRAEA
jgi:type II secretory pathway component PulM